MVEIARIGEITARLGEGPVWNADDQRLYWADIEGKAIHRTDPATGSSETRDLPGRPGSFVFTKTSGRLLVAMETALYWFDWELSKLDKFVDVEHTSTNRLNDGRCDHNGRYIVGTMNPDTSAKSFDGALYSIDRSGSVQILEQNVGIPNSTVFDRERSRMYWADTFHKKIWRWDYDGETGRRSNKSVFFDYSAHRGIDGVPDGACLDVDGCVWSASVNGWALTRITPDGTVDRRIDLPVSMPTMPAFGGPDLSTLYVTSLQGGPRDTKRSNGLPAGALLALEPGVQGMPEPRFGA